MAKLFSTLCLLAKCHLVHHVLLNNDMLIQNNCLRSQDLSLPSRENSLIESCTIIVYI